MVVGSSPAVAMAQRMMSFAFAEGLAASNAVYAQQQAWMQNQTITATDTVRLLGL